MSRPVVPYGRLTKLIILANALVFALMAFLGPESSLSINEAFGLSWAGLENGWWWQLLTHQFLHGNGVHLFVNMLMLWFVGRDMEDVLGGAGFLALYFGGGIAGGLCQLPFLGLGGVLIGASGSVCAVLLALTTVFPRVSIMALLFFIIPIRMKAGVLGLVVVAGSIVLWASNLAPGIGHAAHLGGFAFGFLFAVGFRFRQAHLRKKDHGSVMQAAWQDDAVEEFPQAHTREEVVEKLLRHGLESLSRYEIKLLESSRGAGGSRWR